MAPAAYALREIRAEATTVGQRGLKDAPDANDFVDLLRAA